MLYPLSYGGVVRPGGGGYLVCSILARRRAIEAAAPGAERVLRILYDGTAQVLGST